jgi:hypothetical protein
MTNTANRKQHTENPATGRALCGRELTEDNHGYRSTLESCQDCANKLERARQRNVNGEGK